MERESNWKSMYITLVGKVNEALELLPLFPENVRIYKILEAAMQEAEEIYLSSGGAEDVGETEKTAGRNQLTNQPESVIIPHVHDDEEEE